MTLDDDDEKKTDGATADVDDFFKAIDKKTRGGVA